MTAEAIRVSEAINKAGRKVVVSLLLAPFLAAFFLMIGAGILYDKGVLPFTISYFDGLGLWFLLITLRRGALGR